MSGFLAVGPCVICGGTFSFNPEKVPSLVVDDVRRPICSPCVPNVNAELARLGRPDRVVPLPGAYDMEEA